MSVYIPGMEMPKMCNDCIFDTGGLCLINANLEGKDELTHNCPLTPVPPHGDLIDRDEIKFDWDEDDKTWGYDIHSAPTIIPADGKDTNVPTKTEEEGE